MSDSERTRSNSTSSSLSTQTTDSEADSRLYDVVIIGAGPCGLAVAARLQEHTPSAIFTEEEHSRYHWIRRHGQHANILQKRFVKSQDVKPLPTAMPSTSEKPCYDILVLDATSATWMARWNYLFNKFEIDHLRSPMFFHVDPSDRDALLAFAHEVQLQEELREIRGCVGKELSKHKRKKRAASARLGANDRVAIDERDRKDYYVPSRNLFREHCSHVTARYNLDKPNLIVKSSVKSIAYKPNNDFSEERKVFTIQTDCGTFLSRAVVVATGPGDIPNFPDPVRPYLGRDSISLAASPGNFLTKALKQRIQNGEGTHVVIIGGGLTSAQIADLAIRRGVSKVWLLLRGHLKVKPFDVDLQWVGKFKNHEKSVFWSADSDEERLQHIQQARNGGSVTPYFNGILQEHIRQGSVSLLTHTQISSISPLGEGRWQVTTSPPNDSLSSVAIDHIYLATGKSVSYKNLPFLSALEQEYPIASCSGLPKLTEDLSWAHDVPLFINGALAALRLGPGAGNLEGARVGAERIVWGIQDALGGKEMSFSGADEIAEKYEQGIGGMFEGLAVQGEA